jgi:hypothetical protein
LISWIKAICKIIKTVFCKLITRIKAKFHKFSLRERASACIMSNRKWKISNCKLTSFYLNINTRVCLRKKCQAKNY